MGKMSRDKGKRFELQIANYFKEHGFNTRRSAQYCGNTGEAADVIGLPGIHIECKAVEKMALYSWIEQAERDAQKSGYKPTVIHKQNRKKILVSMYLDDWVELYKGYLEREDT